MGGGELELIQEAFASNYIAPLGPMVEAFEKEFGIYVGIPHCLALNSGTAAMHLALRELGIGPGDNVLASSLTFIGSISPVTFLGASLTFLDSDRSTWNLDPDLLEAEISECARRGKLPKAVIPTDLYGQCADLKRIKAICDTYRIPVVADSAEAMGSKYRESHDGTGSRLPFIAQQRISKSEGGLQKPRHEQATQNREQEPAESGSETGVFRHAGQGVRASVFSFNGNKIITTSGGGMLASDDKDFIEHARKLSQQARDPAPYYQHTEIGYNYRMSNIVAAIGRGQLRVLDNRVARKREIYSRYCELLGDMPGIQFMPEASYAIANRWLTVILIDEKIAGASPEEIRLALEGANIESRPIWKPMHMQPVFKGCGYRGNGVSEDLFSRGLCLPSGTAMSDADQERVVNVIKQAGRSR
jgi:dTDP-4-amino-4,6-dideoxygalactose transaminase